MTFVIERYGQSIDLSIEGKVACPRCRSQGNDHSGDNLMVYGLDSNGKHKGFYCFSCEYKHPSQRWLEDNGKVEEEEIYVVGSYFDLEVNEKIKKNTGTDTKGYRGIRSDISRPFGVRYSYSQEEVS